MHETPHPKNHGGVIQRKDIYVSHSAGIQLSDMAEDLSSMPDRLPGLWGLQPTLYIRHGISGIELVPLPEYLEVSLKEAFKWSDISSCRIQVLGLGLWKLHRSTLSVPTSSSVRNICN